MSRKGAKNFKGCRHRVVEFVSYYQPVDTDSSIWTPNRSDPEASYNMGQVARLGCPGAREQNIQSHVNESRLGAFKELGMLAAELACHACPYSRMAPEKVEEAEARRLRAQAGRVEAQTELARQQQIYEELLASPPPPELPLQTTDDPARPPE